MSGNQESIPVLQPSALPGAEEDRYIPINKGHFDLDTAVVFLQQGGALSGLDNVWNIYEQY